MHDDIKRVAESLGVAIDALKQASELATRDLSHIRSFIRERFPLTPGSASDIDVVFFGSYGRGEATKGSDRDYLVIIHGTTDPQLPPAFIRAVEDVCAEMDIGRPGAQGVFAEIAIGAELYTRIGLETDTNVNTTRRLLLLTESVSAYCDMTHHDLIHLVIDRYCADYDDPSPQADPSRVPRFLLNDLVRYWRTIAVDFGAKRWRALAQDSHVRHGKLLTSRKVMFAGSLASVFLTPRAVQNGTTVRDHLFQEFRKPPLARLAGIYDRLGQPGKDALREILICYNRFIEILDNEQVGRDVLAKAATPAAHTLIEEMKSLGGRIQAGLETIFYDEPDFANLTRRYGLF